jgi:hypothetical protein
VCTTVLNELLEFLDKHQPTLYEPIPNLFCIFSVLLISLYRLAAFMPGLVLDDTMLISFLFYELQK